MLTSKMNYASWRKTNKTSTQSCLLNSSRLSTLKRKPKGLKTKVMIVKVMMNLTRLKGS